MRPQRQRQRQREWWQDQRDGNLPVEREPKSVQQLAVLAEAWLVTIYMMAMVALAWIALTQIKPFMQGDPHKVRPFMEKEESPYCDYYVATNAPATGSGTLQSPWVLDTLWAGQTLADTTAFPDGAGDSVQAHVVCLRGGTYNTGYGGTAGKDTVNLLGTPDNPIVVRSYPGERVIIDWALDMLYSHAADTLANVWLYNLEFTQADTSIHDADPEFLHAVYMQADGLRLINSIIYDVARSAVIQYGCDGQACSSQVYGNLFYNAGYGRQSSPWSTILYMQNDTSYGQTQLVQDNIFGATIGNQIQAFGTTAHLSNLTIRGNIMTMGSMETSGEHCLILYAGGGDSTRFVNDVIDSNATAAFSDSLTRLQPFNPRLCGIVGNNTSRQKTGEYLRFADNYLADGGWQVQNWDSLTVTGNTFIRHYFWFIVDTAAAGGAPWGQPPYDWDNNTWLQADTNSGTTKWRTYYSDGSTNNEIGYLTYGAWKDSTTYDANSTATEDTIPAANHVIVRPNLYETGRGNIAVYNWEALDTVNVDLSDVLSSGDTYEIRHIFDIWTTITTGTWNGSDSIPIPMTGPDTPTPTRGWDAAGGTHYDPAEPWRFEAFIVRLKDNWEK